MPDTEIYYHDVSRETFHEIDKLFDQYRTVLEAYIQRLLWWNRTVNLVSRNASADLIQHHVRHSLLLVILSGFQTADIILDAGSGGGLPGIPLAFCFPNKKFILNDISSKKTRVLNQLKRELGIKNIGISNYPLKDYTSKEPHVDCIISKHEFKLGDILSDVDNGGWDNVMLLKGDDFIQEINQISYPVSIDCYKLESGTDLSFYKGKVMLNIQRI